MKKKKEKKILGESKDFKSLHYTSIPDKLILGYN